MTDAERLQRMTALILAWYDQNARSLPWREEATPYRVWLSEIMLQQTRVEAVKPYFDRFIAAVPDIAALAAVDEERLFKLWEGLGYYSRARNLRRAAATVMAAYGGELPADREALLALAGIGPYTAGAILSIAFGQRIAAVDGNVLRVVSRFLAKEEDIAKEKTKRALADLVTVSIPARRPGDFNQALMELGALVCLPKNPRCSDCPLAALCLAKERGLQDRLPVKAAKKPRRREKRTVFLFLHRDAVALRKREGAGLLAGLWEFPHLPGQLSEMEIFAAFPDHAIREMAALPAAKHIFTHLEWEMTAYLIRLEEPSPEWIWVTWEALQTAHPLPSAFRFYADLLPALLENSGDGD